MISNNYVYELELRIKELTEERDNAIRANKYMTDVTEQALAEIDKLKAENKGLLIANSKLSQIKDQQGYVNALEAALDCLQFTALLELDEHDMPNLKTVLLDSMQIRDEMGEDADKLRQQAKENK